jgi:hypothetical protein
VQIKWKKLNNYCIEYDDLIICKYKTIDSDRFILWQNNKILKISNTAQEAKNEALAFIGTEPTIPIGDSKRTFKKQERHSGYNRGK